MEALSLPYLAICVVVFLVVNAWLIFRPEAIERKRRVLDPEPKPDVTPMVRPTLRQAPRPGAIQRPPLVRSDPASRPGPR